MATRGKVSFEFKNHISPRYVEPLLVQLDYGRWYDSNELQELLRSNGIEVQGKEIINININTWARLGMGEVYSQGYGKQRRFQLTRFGKQIAGFYSTNQELFFEVLHFLFYSAWPRSEGINQSQFWVYHRLCDVLWIEAPRKMEAEQLTARLQSESRDIFPNHEPTFPTQSIRGIFPWLQTLTPPFLAKCSTKSELCSERRSYCTPQLFHLATDLLYTTEGLAYGTSLAMDDATRAGPACVVPITESAPTAAVLTTSDRRYLWPAAARLVRNANAPARIDRTPTPGDTQSRS